MSISSPQSLKSKLHEIIFEADTRAGKLFDVWLLIFILLSLIIVMLDSVEAISNQYAQSLFIIEWFFTIIFSIEYLGRVYSVGKPSHYIFSFYGLIDLLSILPTFINLFIPGYHYFTAIRSLRFIRIFKILKLHQFTGASRELSQALKSSRPKIIVFLVSIVIITTLIGTLMYVIEGRDNGFTSIPRSIYWAIVTLTTVGYGDISPITPLGQFLASIIMILGYGILAVPTGIISTEMAKAEVGTFKNTNACSNCSKEGHADDAVYCKYCGYKL